MDREELLRQMAYDLHEMVPAKRKCALFAHLFLTGTDERVACECQFKR